MSKIILDEIRFGQSIIKYTLLLCLISPACSTISLIDCEKADWQKIGLIDGQRGEDENRFHSHAKSCPNHPATLEDFEKYKKGRTEGLADYCTPSGGYQAGSNGEPYLKVCEKELETVFLEQYQEGKKTQLLKKEHDKVQSDLKQRRKEIAEDKSVLGDVSKVYHLLAGISPTSREEEREAFLTNEIYRRDANAPSGKTFYRPERDPLNGVVAMGGVMGGLFGFGLGHAVLGRYRTEGWKWTAVDASLYTTFGVLAHNCSSAPASTMERQKTENTLCGVSVLTWVLAFLTARVWQVSETVSASAKILSPYNQSNSHRVRLQNVSLIPQEEGMGLGIALGW